MVLSGSRARFGALLLVLALAAGACGNGKKDHALSAKATTTTTDASADSTLNVGSDTTGVSGDTAATAAHGTTATTKKGGAATTAKPAGAGGGSGGGGATTTAAPVDPNAVPGPAKNGTYGYSQSGTTPDGPVPAHGTLVVSGAQQESFNRYFDPNKAPQTVSYDFRSDGPFITSATLGAKGVTINCDFASPVPLPPWPPTPGRTFSGKATCSNGVTATLNGSITSRSGDIVGLDFSVHATGSGIDVTLHDIESWSMSLRVPKKSHQTYSGTSPFGPIAGDATSTLTSTP